MSSNKIDVSKYLIVGPENLRPGLRVADVVSAAVGAGFTAVQLRSKVASAREMIELAKKCAAAIEQSGRKVPLLINDRLDVALACRMHNIRVDGVHMGQDDIPVDVCRHVLGPDAIIGLTYTKFDPSRMWRQYEGAPLEVMPYDIQTVHCLEKTQKYVDYYGIGCVHDTSTKADTQVHPLDDFHSIMMDSWRPLVVGGGVTVADIPAMREQGLDGFFVVSAVCAASDPGAAAKELVDAWDNCKRTPSILDEAQWQAGPTPDAQA